MKYKVGDEVYVKGTIKEIVNGVMYPFHVEFAEMEHGHFLRKELYKADKNYEQGLADAWELAKKIYDMKCDAIEEIFGVKGGFYEVIRNFTFEDCRDKIEAYEKEKEIEVGDVVKFEGLHEEKYGVVLVRRCGTVNGIRADGTPFSWNKNDCTKTGKHIDIESLLKEIGE